MERKAVDAARIEYGRAVQSVKSIEKTDDFPTLETHWAAFLVSAGRIFTKLEQGAKVSAKSKAWWGEKLHQRRTDPLLRYLWHARNADEHTLQTVTELRSGSAEFVEPTSDDIKALEGKMEGETRPWAPLGLIEWTPRHVVLLAVTDREVRYNPPHEHLSQPIDNTSPLHVAGLALAFLEAMLNEADALAT